MPEDFTKENQGNYSFQVCSMAGPGCSKGG